MTEGDKIITITNKQLALALERWENDALSGCWSERYDNQKFIDIADYLIGILEEYIV